MKSTILSVTSVPGKVQCSTSIASPYRAVHHAVHWCSVNVKYICVVLPLQAFIEQSAMQGAPRKFKSPEVASFIDGVLHRTPLTVAALSLDQACSIAGSLDRLYGSSRAHQWRPHPLSGLDRSPDDHLALVRPLRLRPCSSAMGRCGFHAVAAGVGRASADMHHAARFQGAVFKTHMHSVEKLVLKTMQMISVVLLVVKVQCS